MYYSATSVNLVHDAGKYDVISRAVPGWHGNRHAPSEREATTTSSPRHIASSNVTVQQRHVHTVNANVIRLLLRVECSRNRANSVSR